MTIKIVKPKKRKADVAFDVADFTAPLDIETHTRTFDVVKQQVDFIYKMIYEYQDKTGKYPDCIIMDELDVIFITQYLTQECKFGVSAIDFRGSVTKLFGCEVIQAKVPYPICGMKK
jgi:hypothetical protein